MNRFAMRAALLVALACLGCLGESDEPDEPDEPAAPRWNVLLYVVDTLRADALGAYAGGASSPVLDGFARESVLFERAYAPASWTRSSMASLLTGTLPSYHGTESRGHHLPSEVQTLASALREHGYATAFVNANPNVASFFGFSAGFDDMIELYRRPDTGNVLETELAATSDVAGEHAIEWLSSAQRPFLLTVLTIDPHFPYSPPRSFIPGDAALIDVEQSMASNPTRAERLRIREEYARFYRGEVAFNDQSFGTLLDSLRASGELDRTIVVFTSDHGEEFWEHGRFGHGFTLYEEVLHVPLVIRYPQLPEPGLRVKRAVRTVDVVPTLFSLLGLESPPAVAGRSLFEPAGEHPEPVFATLDLEGARFHSLRQGRWKLLVNRETGEKTLFDLEQDPREREPLSPAAHTAGARLERQLNTIAQRRSGFARSGAMEVPADVLEALEALGYAQ